MSEVAANGGAGMEATASETVAEAAQQTQASAGWLLRKGGNRKDRGERGGGQGISDHFASS